MYASTSVKMLRGSYISPSCESRRLFYLKGWVVWVANCSANHRAFGIRLLNYRLHSDHSPLYCVLTLEGNCSAEHSAPSSQFRCHCENTGGSISRDGACLTCAWDTARAVE